MDSNVIIEVKKRRRTRRRWQEGGCERIKCEEMKGERNRDDWRRIVNEVKV